MNFAVETTKIEIMKVYLILFFSLIVSSCKNNENNEILNKDLMLYVKKFIEETKINGYCKSKYIMIEITKDKIYISNSEPTFRKNFLGYIEFEESNLYFYSSGEYLDFVKIKKKDFKLLEKNYSNNCHPSKDKILLIDKKNRNILKQLKIN